MAALYKQTRQSSSTLLSVFDWSSIFYAIFPNKGNVSSILGDEEAETRVSSGSVGVALKDSLGFYNSSHLLALSPSKADVESNPPA